VIFLGSFSNFKIKLHTPLLSCNKYLRNLGLKVEVRRLKVEQISRQDAFNFVMLVRFKALLQRTL